MTKQEQVKRKLVARVKILKASAQVLLQEATDIERELEGIYPPATIKQGKFQLSDEDKVKVRAQSMARRGIPLNDKN